MDWVDAVVAVDRVVAVWMVDVEAFVDKAAGRLAVVDTIVGDREVVGFVVAVVAAVAVDTTAELIVVQLGPDSLDIAVQNQ